MQIFPTSRHFARFFFRRAAATAPTASRCMSQREAPSSGPEVFFLASPDVQMAGEYTKYLGNV